MRPADLLSAYVRGLCSLTGARGVSLYVPATRHPVSRPVLIHDGDLQPLPELANLDNAEAFRRRIGPSLQQLKRDSPGMAAVAVASDMPDARLIGIFSGSAAPVPERRQQARQPPDGSGRAGGTGEPQPDLWLGLRLADRNSPQSIVADMIRLEAVVDQPRALDTGWTWLLGFACELARHTRHVSEVLDDPVTGLPGRAEFQTGLERAVERALDERVPLTLLLINPDDFAALNQRISREAADRVIFEIAERLKSAHRSSDLVARYGSVVFASVLLDAEAREGVRRADQVLQRLHAAAFLDGTVSIRFSVGVASSLPGEAGTPRALDLIRRANLALSKAKRSGGGRLAAWEPGAEEQAGYLDRLTGIFTGQVSKDYRNMAVLSDMVSILAGHADPHVLAMQAVKELHGAMKPEQAGLFEWSDEGRPRLIYGESRGGAPGAAPKEDERLPVGDEQRRLLELARERQRAVESRSGTGPAERLSFAVPLVASERVLGALYLAGHSDSMSLDSSDLVFLEALAAQLALALDRAQLSDRQRRHEQQERSRLKAELEELRGALRGKELLYRSGPMEALLDRVRRVAPTDATVLLTGESGTGKELVARTIHVLSVRREQPYVVVDCGAIPTTLIESELFGHEKGAFTGAQQRQPGRLLQADRGTLLLDEVGELPLEAQSKLLRFVQERHVTPVGGRAARVVDVRVLAATNRDLQAEVAAGRFRADLYHRLNVVRLELPPLRARPDDVLHLAQHFRERYSLLYGRTPVAFSAEAEALLVRHGWPGNVRELENRVMRAVILCQGTALSAADLGIAEDAPSPPEPAHPRPAAASASPSDRRSPPGDGLGALRTALAVQIDLALAGPKPMPPLGRWLADDLVLEADAAAGGVGSRAAAILGLPETTLRRRLEQVRVHTQAGWPPRSESWPVVRACLAELARGGGNGALFRQARQILLEEVLARTPGDSQAGAALCGVTLPTFRRRSGAAGAGEPA